jgi:hypothetical protein
MTNAEDIIHFRADDMESLSACGVNIDTTPYTFATPERQDVTCPTCIAKMPKPEPAQPDPTKTGPCELNLSFACTGAGYERLDPRDMLKPETSFRTPRIICLPCYELAADHYISEVHS